MQPIDIEALCAQRGLRITDQRRVIARVLSESRDHPDVESLHERAAAIDPRISIATVYRTVRLFEEAGILDRHDFGDGRARYEAAPEAHHDHMIDVESGKVIEFVDPEIEIRGVAGLVLVMRFARVEGQSMVSGIKRIVLEGQLVKDGQVAADFVAMRQARQPGQRQRAMIPVYPVPALRGRCGSIASALELTMTKVRRRHHEQRRRR